MKVHGAACFAVFSDGGAGGEHHARRRAFACDAADAFAAAHPARGGAGVCPARAQGEVRLTAAGSMFLEKAAEALDLLDRGAPQCRALTGLS